MRANLDTLRSEIQEYLESRGIAVFHGTPRGAEDVGTVYWDTEHYPDYRTFIATAEAASVRLVTLYANEFTDDIVDDALHRLQATTFPRDERRAMEQQLREVRGYGGFTCQIELSFDIARRVYIFDLRTDWYEDLSDLLDRIDDAFEQGDDEDPLSSGYFSKN